MITYKLQNSPFPVDGKTVVANVCKTNTETGHQWAIPFDPANTDYSNFKKEVLNGAELQDADGNVLTQEEAVAFINELP